MLHASLHLGKVKGVTCVPSACYLRSVEDHRKCWIDLFFSVGNLCLNSNKSLESAVTFARLLHSSAQLDCRGCFGEICCIQLPNWAQNNPSFMWRMLIQYSTQWSEETCHSDWVGGWGGNLCQMSLVQISLGTSFFLFISMVCRNHCDHDHFAVFFCFIRFF